MVAMLDAVVANLSEQRRASESQLSSNATSILFKLSCKLTPEEAAGMVGTMAGTPHNLSEQALTSIFAGA